MSKRAASICNVPGCYEYAVKDGRCAEHQREHHWDTSNRVKAKGWDKRRRHVLYKARYRCAVCGRRAKVVDHIRAQAFGGTERVSNLQALCYTCHNAKTADEARLGKALKQMPVSEREAAIAELVDRWS